MKPSELAAELELVDSKFKQPANWDSALSTLQALIIDDLSTIICALRHHEALVGVVKFAAKRCRCNGTGIYTRGCTRCGDSTEDHECNDEERACLAEPCLSARELLATIEREGNGNG